MFRSYFIIFSVQFDFIVYFCAAYGFLFTNFQLIENNFHFYMGKNEIMNKDKKRDTFKKNSINSKPNIFFHI